MSVVHKHRGRKKVVSLSINSDLLIKARECGFNLSAVMEDALAKAIRNYQHVQWRRENLEAISAYNELVDQEGTFSDPKRRF